VSGGDYVAACWGCNTMEEAYPRSDRSTVFVPPLACTDIDFILNQQRTLPKGARLEAVQPSCRRVILSITTQESLSLWYPRSPSRALQPFAR